MSLHAYGLLIGKIVGFREPRGRKPHWLLMVRPGNPHHPAYRVAINAPTAQPDDHSEIEYQIVRLDEKLPLVSMRRYLKQHVEGTPSFLLAEEEVASFPRLDYQKDDFVVDDEFPSEKTREPKVGTKRRSHKQDVGPLQKALRAACEGNAMVAVFGTGAPMDHCTGIGAATGFTGVENVHMNQGAFNRTNGTLHYLENERDQDGWLIVLAPDSATGIFIKFRSQTLRTDGRGYPVVTGIADIDAVQAEIRKAIMPPIPGEDKTQPVKPRSVSAAAVSAPAVATPATANGRGYVFADFDSDDASGQYIPANDANTYQTPIVQDQSKGHTRGPVPTPRENPVMTLASVTGDNPPGHTVAADGTESIAFDIIGDSGAPSMQHLTEFETKVADLLAKDAAASQPAFLFHVGDVVYFYGEKQYYYSQFYDPFRAYPAPIFAIPGNHDGCIYDPSQISLADFQSAFCSLEPGRWVGAGGILRSKTTQHGVYFS